MKMIILAILASISLSACDSFQEISSETTYSDVPLTIESKSKKNYYYFDAVDEKGRTFTGSSKNCHNFDYYQVGTLYLMVLETQTKKYKSGKITKTSEIKPCGTNAPQLKSNETIS